ncbi:hypothetical protein RRG08_051274 [Elysia crispata]|uniref:Glutathione peroxidase n=1 Tax=Elysia crispata TaxID=231223 RepID=A0AAE0YCR0_9GAST|nr:hypothetical protein RRG08_051274 [Elysia crispata]
MWLPQTSLGPLVAFCGLITVAKAGMVMNCNQPADDDTTIYNFSLMDINKNKTINLSDYQGKLVMIVNYIGLNALNSKYGGRGFVVLAFPCNIFLKQEPGANGTEILNGVKYVRPGGGFEPNFQLFEKIDVNGNKEHKLYTYLKSYCPPTQTEFKPSILFYTPIKANDVSWNFEKFLVGTDGRVMKRAHPSVDPVSMEMDVENALPVPAASNGAGRVSPISG